MDYEARDVGGSGVTIMLISSLKEAKIERASSRAIRRWGALQGDFTIDTLTTETSVQGAEPELVRTGLKRQKMGKDSVDKDESREWGGKRRRSSEGERMNRGAVRLRE